MFKIKRHGIGSRRRWGTVPVFLFPALADACSVCVSNASYNMAPFSAVWILVLFGWTAFLGGLAAYKKRMGFSPPTVRKHFTLAWKYLVAVIVLYVLGLHLFAILLLPLLLLKAAFSSRSPETRVVKIGAAIALALLIITAPVFYRVLPRTTSEVGARTWEAAVRQELKKLIASKSENAAGRKVDPFAYQMFDVPGFGILVQSPGFYRPLLSDNHLLYTAAGKQRAAWSRGPDGKLELSKQIVNDALQEGRGGVSQMLATYAYDATNGIVSAGDIVAITNSR